VVSKSTVTLDEIFTVSGAGFNFAEPVTLFFIVDDKNQRNVGSVTANESGAFQIEISSLGGTSSSGVKTLLAQGADGSRASTPIVVVATSLRAAPPPVASVSIGLVGPGQEITVYGAGFIPDEFVSFTVLSASSGSDKIIAGAQANASGAIQAIVTIDLDIGVYSVKALGDQGSEATGVLAVVDK
jgi:hypothetical protein